MLKYVAKDRPRRDAVYRVTGRIKYTADIQPAKPLHAALLHSPYPHAVVKQIDVSKALKTPGVATVLTPFNVPQHRFGRTFSPVPWKVICDRKIIDRVQRFAGDIVAAVAADSPETAYDAVEKIEVDYEVLDYVDSAEKALQPDAPLVHDEIEVGGAVKKLESNIGFMDTVEIGSREEAYSRVVKTYEDSFRTQILYNAAIEPRAMIVSPRPDGTLDVYCTTQSIHGTRYWLAKALQLPMNKVVVHGMTLGGGFGAKYNLAIHEPVIAYLAQVTGRTVKFVSTRQQDFYTTARRAAYMDVRLGVSREGRIEAMEMRAVLQSGAYADHMLEAVTCTGGWFISSYAAGYRYFEGKGVYTNLPVCGAMRGFGNPQQNFALESLVDEIAEDLGMDPLEFRLKNLPRVGDIYYGQGPTVTTVIRSMALEQVARKTAAAFGWTTERRVVDGVVRACGVAVGHHTSGTGGEMSEQQDRQEGAGVVLKLNEDGTVSLNTAMVEMGPGEHETLAAICAEALGTRPEDVYVEIGNTQYTPFDMGTHASRGTYVGGLAVVSAAEKLREQILTQAAEMLECSPKDLQIEDGWVRHVEDADKRLSLSDVAMRFKTRKGFLPIAVSGLRPNAAPPSWAVIFAQVAVDLETGAVKVEKIAGGYDIGTVINPSEAAGQAHGGIATGIGYALLEEVVVQDGKYINPSFMDYLLPSATDIAETLVFFADSTDPYGPFGAKSIGELATNPVASAIANAVSRAIGKRVKKLPLSPETVLKTVKLF
ncbi:MAG: xanthine dehydrogenase family protein molybdopterin-binding subunit [Candidatus Caldarchaeum sp.]|uniref:Xanthine dehydrogenase family protein molybdopterin-binding subunit n=2 Tax=Caldiarchaeum subterraneum TaxID=311458 RepID=A0A7C4I1Q3_CALS0|nr:xanthine dehydrogenase family protein molybdopterin-binding subunit [Candidatus Caldarchaeales archaeon]